MKIFKNNALLYRVLGEKLTPEGESLQHVCWSGDMVSMKGLNITLKPKKFLLWKPHHENVASDHLRFHQNFNLHRYFATRLRQTKFGQNHCNPSTNTA